MTFVKGNDSADLGASAADVAQESDSFRSVEGQPVAPASAVSEAPASQGGGTMTTGFSSMERIGKYEILEEIGQGGFGTVYKGRDSILKRLVAIKTCNSDEEELRLRFQQEAEIVASLQHPNVTTVHDLGTHEGVPYLVQEFLTGEDLSAVVKRQDDLPLETKLDYLLQSARALEFAHANHIIHRDIKPGNIRVLDDGSVKVMDFGIAKLANLETKLTRTGMMMGTAAYLAPELIGDGKVDPRVDIFSFGVVAFELLSYTRPFRGSTLSALLYQLVHADAPPLITVFSRVAASARQARRPVSRERSRPSATEFRRSRRSPLRAGWCHGQHGSHRNGSGRW